MAVAASNYDITLARMPAEFLKYDQQRMIRNFSLDRDADYLYLTFTARPYRVGRKTGLVQWQDGAGSWRNAGFSDGMTVYDLLCDAGDGCCLSGRFCRASQLKGTAFGLDPAHGMGGTFARLCDRDPQALAAACRALGGEDLRTGEVSYRIPVFPFFPAVLQFWSSDEDFPASFKLMWDENALDFMKYETLCYCEGFLMSRLKGIMEGENKFT